MQAEEMAPLPVKELSFIFLLAVLCASEDEGTQYRVVEATGSENQSIALALGLINQTGLFSLVGPREITKRRVQDGRWNFSSSTKKKLPEFMLKLYESLNKDQTHSEQERQLPLGADSVRSFTHIGGRTSHFPIRLKFKITIPPSERILFAIIQCYIHFSSKNEEANKKDLKPRYVNLILSNRQSNLTVSRLVRVQKTPSLVTFPVTKAIHHARNSTVGVILFSMIALPFPARSAGQWDLKVHSSRNKQRQPVMVAFIRDEQGIEKSSIDLPRFLGFRSLYPKVRRYPRETTSCHVADLPVNFYEIGYKHIIAPLTYNAKQCLGRCTFPLGKNSKANIHAQIQAILHSLKGAALVAEVSCVPVKLSSITLIYSDQTFGNSLVLRSFPDMVVDECGCR